MTLSTRPPTGKVPWPLILVEGPEKAGKSWACAELSASPRVGQTYWIDLGEGSADEYGAIPGARYLVVEHDGSFSAILSAVEEIKAIAAKAAGAGEPPVVLVIDSMTAEWDALKAIADQRARQRLAKKGRSLAVDAEPQISMDLWNEVNGRHRKLMTHLMTFPGIAVMTARGKEVASLDDSGRPIEGTKEYKVDGQKHLAFDASVWIRVGRDNPPLVVGARSVYAGIKPGTDKPKVLPDLSLERVVFEILRCGGASHVRHLVNPIVTAADLAEPDGAPVPAPVDREPELAAVTAAATSKEALAAAWSAMVAASRAGEISADASTRLKALWQARRDEVASGPSAVAGQDLHRRMHALWREAGFGEDRDARLAFTSEVLGRPVTTSAGLTVADADQLIERLVGYVRQNEPPADPPASPMTPDQRDAIYALLARTGLDVDRARGLQVVNEAITPAVVNSLNPLTYEQAERVVAALEALPAVPAVVTAA